MAWLSRPKKKKKNKGKVTQEMPKDLTESEMAEGEPDKGYN